jgi:hypothetical protein
MKVFDTILVRIFLASLASLAAFGSFAAGLNIQDLEEGKIVVEDRVDMGFLSPIPIPPGKWRVLKKTEYKVPWSVGSDLEMTRVTLINTDKDSPLRLFSFSTNTKRNLRAGAPPLWMCHDFPGAIFTQKQFDLPTSGFVYACSNIRSNPDVKAKLVSFQDNNNVASRGYVEGLVKPLLNSPQDLDSLGQAPISVELEVSKSGERIAYYSFWISAEKKYTSINDQMPEIVQLSSWLKQTGKEIIKSTNGEDFNLPALLMTAPFSGSNVLTSPQLDMTNAATMEVPTTSSSNREAYLNFLQTAPPNNRAWYFSLSGASWGWSKGAWPFNERNAFDACFGAARGKGFACKAHTIDDQVVWDQAKPVN